MSGLAEFAPTSHALARQALNISFKEGRRKRILKNEAGAHDKFQKALILDQGMDRKILQLVAAMEKGQFDQEHNTNDRGLERS